MSAVPNATNPSTSVEYIRFEIIIHSQRNTYTIFKTLMNVCFNNNKIFCNSSQVLHLNHFVCSLFRACQEVPQARK